MSRNWYGLTKIEFIQHVRDGKVLWEERNILNTLHSEGEWWLLKNCFNTETVQIPSSYYFGLDNRDTISIGQTMASLVEEPIGGGYARVAVNSLNGFEVSMINGIYRAISPLLQFTSVGGGYGPVKNLFLTTSSGNSGKLISSNALSSAISPSAGDTINLRMSLQLRDSAS